MSIWNEAINMKKVIGNIVFIAVLLIIIARFAAVFNGVIFPANVIASSSMEPLLKKGDIVIWVPASMDEVEEGDIVVYRSIYGNIIIHRVVEKRGDALITKGDANNYTDQAGPHVPEPMVREQNLLGKVIMIKNMPLKIPFLGKPWLWIQELASMLTQPLRYSHGNGEKFVIFLPFMFSLSLFMLLFLLWLPNGKEGEQKLHELIFGPEKISAKQLLHYLMLMFIPFLLLSSFFAYDSRELDEKKEIPVFNPSLLSVKGFSFIEERKASINMFKLSSGEVKMIRVNGEKGERVFVYSSPYWLLIPNELMKAFCSLQPRAAVFLSSLLAAVILSFIALIFLIVVSLAVEKISLFLAYISLPSLKYHIKFSYLYRLIAKIKSKINIFRGKIRNMLTWMEALGRVDKRVLLLPLITIAFIPLVENFANILLASLISSAAVSLALYSAGCRFKNEFAMASIISSSILSSALMFKVFYYGDNTPVALIQYVAIFLIILLMIFFLQFLVMLICISFIHIVRERIDPSALLEVCDI